MSRTSMSLITFSLWMTAEAKSYDNEGKIIQWTGKQCEYIERTQTFAENYEEMAKTKRCNLYSILIDTKNRIFPQLGTRSNSTIRW